MKVAAVLIPLLFQLGVVAFVMAGSAGKGGFIGLMAMLLAIFALPITALINWMMVRKQPPMGFIAFVAGVFFNTLAFPALLLAGYAFGL